MAYKIYIYIILSLFANSLYSQYAVSLIADSLKKDARIVTRLDEKIFEIKSPSKASVHEHHIYTILNEGGKNFGGYVTDYDKFKDLGSVNCILYDANGKELKHIKKKDMADESGSGDETLMTDTRYKIYNFGYGIYPYTVDFEEDYDIDGILDIDDWMPQEGPGIAVENSHFSVIAPKDYTIRFKTFNYNTNPVITEQSDKKKYTWELKNLLPKIKEASAPPWHELVPYVKVSPTTFEAQGYKGDMSSWQGYGKFIYDLLQGRDILPDEIKKKVHEIADPIKDPYDKIYALYDFLQKNTRYISIQLGIGGLQPFEASFVASKKYGDCKALSNYMVALLKEAGIKANSVSVAAGEDALDVIEDFPCHQFNHRIACVPINKDTLWLECTNQTTSPGYMSSFTGNRKALLVDETGGYLVSTPVYTANENTQYRKIDASISNEGNLDANLNTKYSGISSDLPHGLMFEASKEQRDRYLNAVLNLPTYRIDKSDYSEKKGKIPEVTEYLHLTSPNYASVSGKRLFLAPNLFNKSQERLTIDSARKYPFVNRFAFRYVDSIALKIPEGYSPEAVPKEVNIKNKFGAYSMKVKIEGVNIYCIRYFEDNSGRFPPSDYPELVKFYDDIYKADRSKIVFVKKDS